MSRANLPPLGIILTVDDSQALASVRGAYAKLQAEVESRGLKVPLTVTDAGGGRGATFGTPGVAPTLTSTAGFQVNRPVAPGSGFGFNIAPASAGFAVRAASLPDDWQARRQAMTESLFGPARQQLAAYQDRVRELAEADPRGETTESARGRRGTGVFDRPSPTNLRFISTIAALETASIVGAVGMMSNPLLNRNASQTMQTQEQAITRLQSGLVGSVVGGVLGAMDSASLVRGFSTAGATRGFGILGRYSPLATQAAQIGAEEGLAGVQAGTESIQRRRASAQTASQISAEAAQLRETSSFRRQRMAAYDRVQNQGAAMELEAANLQQEMLDAQAAGDTIGVGRASRRIQTIARTAPGLMNSAWERFHAEYEGINRERDIRRRAIGRAGHGLRARIELQFGRASEEEFESGLENELEDTDPEFRGTVGARQGLQRGARLAGINEDIRRRQVQTSSILMRSQGRPYSSAISDLAEQRKQALQNARFGTFNVFGHDLSFDERPSINAEYDAKERALGADRVRETRLLQLGLGGRAAQLRALSDPTMRGGDVIGAQAIGISTQGHIQAEQFRQQERPVQAGEALKNALSEENLLKRNYIDSFRAVQFDTRENFFNPRDQEDIGKTLHSIEEEIRGLRTDLQVEQ